MNEIFLYIYKSTEGEEEILLWNKHWIESQETEFNLSNDTKLKVSSQANGFISLCLSFFIY